MSDKIFSSSLSEKPFFTPFKDYFRHFTCVDSKDLFRILWKFSNDNTAYVYDSGSTTCSSTTLCYSYYTHIAATAGTNPSSGNSISDICPKGWKLPSRAEYETMTSGYTNFINSPFYGTYAGYYMNSALGSNSSGSSGFYWTSTVNDLSNAPRLRINSSGTNFLDNVPKGRGFSVRCIAK